MSLNPNAAPAALQEIRQARLRALGSAAPLLIIVLLSTGGIYLRLFTPSIFDAFLALTHMPEVVSISSRRSTLVPMERAS